MKNNLEIGKRVVVVKDVFRVNNKNKIKEFNGYHAIAYAGMQLMYVPFFESAITSVNGICEMSNITNRNTKKNIKEAIEDLVAWKLIEIDVDEIKNGNQFSAKIPNMDTDRFTTINNQFVWDIISSNYSIQEKGNMMLVYMVLAQYMGNHYSAYPSIEQISEDTNLSVPTIVSVLNSLKEIEIIYYGNNGYQTVADNQIKRQNNVYIFRDMVNAKEVFDKVVKQSNEEEAQEEDMIEEEPKNNFIDYTEYEIERKSGQNAVDDLFK